MNRNIFIAFTIIFVFTVVLTSCSSGGGGGGGGRNNNDGETIVIDTGSSGTGSSGSSGGGTIRIQLSTGFDFEHRIRLQGPDGVFYYTAEEGQTSVQFALSEGIWDITIDAYYLDELYAQSDNISLDIRAGWNSPYKAIMNGTSLF